MGGSGVGSGRIASFSTGCTGPSQHSTSAWEMSQTRIWQSLQVSFGSGEERHVPDGNGSMPLEYAQCDVSRLPLRVHPEWQWAGGQAAAAGSLAEISAGMFLSPRYGGTHRRRPSVCVCTLIIYRMRSSFTVKREQGVRECGVVARLHQLDLVMLGMQCDAMRWVGRSG